MIKIISPGHYWGGYLQHDLIPPVAEVAAAIRSKYSHRVDKKVGSSDGISKKEGSMLRAINDGYIF